MRRTRGRRPRRKRRRRRNGGGGVVEEDEEEEEEEEKTWRSVRSGGAEWRSEWSGEVAG